MAEPVVVLDRVTRTYPKSGGGVHDLSLRLEPGECYGLLGRNGAGKTTALRLVMGMLRPGDGTVRIFGLDPFADPERARLRVGYLAEDQELPTVLTPADVLRLYSEIYPGWDAAFAASLADRLRLPLGRRMADLSKGQRRQAGLVAAVAHRPALLVLDEPAGGLDPVVRREFLEQVVEMLSSGGTTVLFSSHNLPEVERIAGRIGILDGGRLVLEGDLAALRDGSCRVLVDGDGVRAESLPGCVRASFKDGATVLTFLCAEDEARRRVREALGRDARQVVGVSLEDLFVDLVGERE